MERSVPVDEFTEQIAKEAIVTFIEKHIF